MHGVVALVSRRADAPALTAAALERLRHRDDCVVVRHDAEGVSLGVCAPPGRGSLAVERGVTDGRPALAVAASGELAEHGRLARELGLGAGASTAEVVLDAYRRRGALCFADLDGVFALVVHDPEVGTYGAVDPCGVAGLFAHPLGDDVWLAGEAKALAADPRFTPRLDRRSLAELLVIGNTSLDASLFEGCVPAPRDGHLVVRDGRVVVEPRADLAGIAGGRLRGAAYTACLSDAIADLAAGSLEDERLLLPVTGGVDSRLLVAALPDGARPRTVTFGQPDDADSRRAAAVARRKGLPHDLLPMRRDYVAAAARETVWLTEGALNPVDNITGSLMKGLTGHSAFVTGSGGETGRRHGKGTGLMPDLVWLRSRTGDFEEGFRRRHAGNVFDEEGLAGLLGPDGRELAALARGRQLTVFDATRGVHPVDRIDLYETLAAQGRSRLKLRFAGHALQPRAPYFTRRWVAATLAGAPRERLDDVARLRLIRALDAGIAEVPWVLTHLPLGPSIGLELGLRGVAEGRWLGTVAGGWVKRSAARDAGAGLPATAAGPSRAAAARKRLKSALYRPSEARERWLRAESGAYIEQVLLAERTLERGLFRPDTVRRLVAEQLAGSDRSAKLGLLLTVELWQRLFVDRERP